MYPEVGRIVLTGQAEMEMVIAAINEGAVFRFLTKPWDEDELKLTIHLAVEHVKEQKASSSPVETDPQANAAQEALDQLETSHPGLTHLDKNSQGVILINDDDL